MHEFDLIKKFFAPLADCPEALALQDDAALLDNKWVITTDAIVSGTHFFGTEPAELIAKKLLRVNLSDLASKGAKPCFYTLALTLPRTTTPEWLSDFSRGLAEDQQLYGLKLIGGDTTSGPTSGSLTATVTAFGLAPESGMIKRSGANVGDDVYVTGTIGDAALGLDEIKASTESRSYLAGRYLLPEPRLAVGMALAGVASAAMDISDGLLADAGHMAAASKTGIEIELDKIPLSDSAKTAITNNSTLIEKIITGGDDYEILFTANPAHAATIAAISSASSTAISCIGRVVFGGNIALFSGGESVPLPEKMGYRHF